MSRGAKLDHWQDAWQQALLAWSRYTRLRYPVLCRSHVEASRYGLSDSFAMIRFADQSVVIDMQAIDELDLHDCAVEILAHEIGHHVLSPATTTDHTRMIARMLPNLPTVEKRVNMVANLYSDLLINHHLKQQCDLHLDHVYRKLNRQSSQSQVWHLYMRIYEILWLCAPGELGGCSDSDSMEGDAWLGARIIKVYGRDVLKGAARFAALLLPYLLADQDASKQLNSLMDTRTASSGQMPSGLIEADQDEDDRIHPSEDKALAGDRVKDIDSPTTEPQEAGKRGSTGQYRQPFEYGEILRAAGISISDHDAAVRYYKERALPHIVPFPSRPAARVFDQIPEGTELWESGEALENVDWFASQTFSPVIIPGVTTVQRVWADAPGHEPEIQPCYLDIYVDCSGSMPNPQVSISYTALAGAILCLSALRAGAAVQVTLWSGKHQFRKTDGFVRNEQSVLTTLTDYLGGGTAFPLHVMRDTYLHPTAQQPMLAQPVHIVVLSDDGVTTMFDQDEQDHSGWDIARSALAKAGAGGTMVLNLPWNYPNEDYSNWHQQDHQLLKQAEKDLGWSIFRVAGWEDMLDFARQFSHQHYRYHGKMPAESLT